MIGDRCPADPISQLFHLTKMNHRLIGDPLWPSGRSLILSTERMRLLCLQSWFVKVQPLQFGQLSKSCEILCTQLTSLETKIGNFLIG